MNIKLFEKQLLFPLSILFIIGFFFRFYKLSFQSYWLDEARTVMRVLWSDFFYSLKTGFGVADPPLYEFILYFWVKLFGTNEFPARAFSAIFSIFTLPLMYLTAKEFFDKKTAIFSTLLLTFSAYHIFYAQEARMYAFSWFLVMASVLFFIKSIKKGGKGNWLIYFITTVFAFYAHYSFFFVLLAQNIFVFMFSRSYRIKLLHWISIQLLVIILFLPWVWVSIVPYLIIPTFIKKALYLFIDRPAYKEIFETLILFIWGHDWMVAGYANKYLFFCKGLLFLIGVMIFLSIWATFRQRESSQKKEGIFFMLLWCFLPISILYLISIFIAPCYQPKYVGPALFPIYILIAYSLNKIRIRFLKIFVLAVFLIPNMFALYRYYNFPVKGEAREIAQYIKSKKTIADAILIHDLIGGIDAFRYYYPGTYNISYSHPDSLKEIIKKGDNFWFLMPSQYKESLLEILKNKGAGEDFLNIYYVSEKVELKTTEVFLFKRRNYNQMNSFQY